MVFKSIRWRIQMWHGSLLLGVVTALLVTFYIYERGARLGEMDGRLQSFLTPLLPMLTRGGPPGPDPRDFPGRPPPPEGPRNGAANLPLGSDMYYVAWSPDGRLLNKSTNAPVVQLPGGSRAGGPNLLRTRGEFREIVHHGPGGDTVVMGISMARMNREMNFHAFALAGFGVVLVTLGLAGGWWAAGRALRPIAQISTTAGQIADGDLSQRIGTQDTESELGQLVTVLNRTFERLDKAFAQQLRFTADASHELRTPISVMLTQIQLACSRPRDAEFYRQTLETCGRAAERMRVLVNSLLELARVDSGELELTLGECDLARIARESLEFITPLAKEKSAVLRESLQPVAIRADAMRLGQVVINLLNNAVQHNGEGVQVTVAVERQAGLAILRVTDNGTGIPEEAQAHLFERFYRADKSRSRASGGSGLGLAISKAIVEAHGGTLRVRSEPGQGTEFQVELPLA